MQRGEKKYAVVRDAPVIIASHYHYTRGGPRRGGAGDGASEACFMKSESLRATIIHSYFGLLSLRRKEEKERKSERRKKQVDGLYANRGGRAFDKLYAPAWRGCFIPVARLIAACSIDDGFIRVRYDLFVPTLHTSDPIGFLGK